MAFEQDPCNVHASTGELLVRGFVREHEGSQLVVEASHFAGTWLEPGDAAVVEVLSPDRGACTYDAVVAYSAARRIGLTDLRLRTVVQQRSALRVPVSVPERITHQVDGRELVPLDEPIPIVVIDASAHGLRFRSEAVIDVGSRFALTFSATRRPLDLQLEVLRVDELRGAFAYGCRLVGATERERDAMFTYVLGEQRRQLAQRADTR
ncbi:MAG: PilZ domain-containing protein [Cellulomonadaceae bacterium]|nr:PilZ domain-containing protein [Cellulomonadaceae bacterium]